MSGVGEVDNEAGPGCASCLFPAGWLAALFANLWGGLILSELVFGPPDGVGVNDGYPFVFLWWLPLLGISMVLGFVGGIAAMKTKLVKKTWAIVLIVFSLLPGLLFVVLLIISSLTGAF